MAKKTIRDLDIDGKRALVRVDYNVPLEPGSGRILDDTRVRATLPTIAYLREGGAKVILCSHLGRPKGTRDPSLSLSPVAERLSDLLAAPVITTDCCIGADVQQVVHSLEPGQVLLLENLRFHPGEEANDPEYAKALASLAEVYVNDAFGAAHRAHASTQGVTRYLPAVAGFLMEKELEFLGKAVAGPERPYAAIIGGAKISTKMTVLEAMLDRVDKLLIGGGMANTFLKAEGFDVGESLIEDDFLDQARRVMDLAKEKGVQLLLPTDVIVADGFAADAKAKRVSVKDVPAGWRIMDIGETTLDVFARALDDCRTVVWNGPMGVIELGSFAHGSHRLAGAIAGLKHATTILGGGETAAVASQLGLADRFSHVSTGGGASMEFLEGRELPGVAALADA
jgi:phosphoglycerate kinase